MHQLCAARASFSGTRDYTTGPASLASCAATQYLCPSDCGPSAFPGPDEGIMSDLAGNVAALGRRSGQRDSR